MRLLYLFPVLALFIVSLTTVRAQCPTISAGEDIYLCFPPTPAQLNGSIDGSYLDFTWSPLAGLIGAQTLTPTVTTTQNATYVLTVRGVDLSNNLITNGDFESGNSGFWSDYIYNPGDLVPEGVYDVLANPQDDHPSFAPCPDHTSGNGNMMAVNGAGMPNQNVWCQTVPVTPGTDFAFSAWVTTLVASSPALLQFSINGTIIGPIFGAPNSTCNWINFYTTWNSGANSSATICIVNQNTVLGGNDFALDDIVFSPICVVTDTVQVKVINITAVANPPISIIPCDGANITLNGNGSSTGPEISYLWETQNGNIVSGETTLNPVVNAAGTYTLTVTYNNGFAECTKTASVNVIENPNQLFAWILPANPIGCGSSTSLLVGNSSQPGFSSYQWTAGPGGHFTSGTTGSTATVDAPGEYTLVVTNTTTGCTAEASVIVITATNPPTAVASVNDTVSCQLPLVNISGIGSSTGNNIDYAWSAISGGNIVAGQDSIVAVVNGGGTYVLTVTNTTNGCTGADTVVVIADLLAPAVTIAPSGPLNCKTDTITLSATINPNVPDPVWTAFNGGIIASGDSTLTPKVISSGMYVLTATNPDNGCKGLDTIIVAIDTLPPIAVALPADTITCQQPSITLSGAGSSSGPEFIYLWTAAAGGNIVSGDSTLNPVVNAAGTYTLLVTDTTNACSADSLVVVIADANALVAVANAPDTLSCTDTLALLNAIGSSNIPGLIYSWSTGNGLIVSGADTPTPTVGAPGTYTLLLTNPANGCTATDGATALQNIAAPNLSIAAPDTLTCSTPSQTLQGQNNTPGNHFNYFWTASGGGNILSGDSTLSPLINAAGNYTLTATNLINGCTAQVTTLVVIEAGTPVAIAAAPGPISCTNPTQTLNSSGSSSGPNFGFAWTASAGGNIISGANSPNPVVDAPGLYALTVTNSANGCTATASVTILEDISAPPAEAGPSGLLTCAHPIFSLSANNGLADSSLIYSWQTPNGGFSGNPDSITVNTMQAGTYILTVLNPQNGCSATDSTLVTANQTAPNVSIPTPDILTCSQTTSSLNSSGANANFIYQWTTSNGQFVSGQNSPAPVVDAPGQYDLIVTDTVNGCTSSLSVNVLQDIAIPQADAGPTPTLTCSILQASLQGTVEPGANIVALWTSSNGNIVSGAGSSSPTVDQPGDYLLTVTNTGNGCTNTAIVTVLQNMITPTANAGSNATLSCSVSSLQLNGTGAANGSPVYNWTASNGGNITAGGNTLTPTINAPGLYTLLVTDLDNGCTAIDTLTVFNDAGAPMASASSPGPLTCTVTQLNLQGNGSVGPNFSHSWLASAGGSIVSGANTLSPTINMPGVYTLTITNMNNGCTATAQVTVNQNLTAPVVSIAPPNTLTCTVQSVSLSGAPNGGAYDYFWQTTGGQIVSGGFTATALVNQTGSYTLLVTSQVNGCTATATVQVISNTTPPVITISTPEILTCLQSQTALNGTVIQPVNGALGSWATLNGHFVSGQSGLSPVVDAPGDYTLTVQDQQNGCTTTSTVAVQQNITPPLADAGPPPTISCAMPQVSLDGSGSSGQGLLSFSWSGGQITSGANSPAPVVSAATGYILTVTDAANGCTSTAAVTVLENTTPPTVLIASPLLRTCSRDTVELTATVSTAGANFSINWTTANGQFASGQNSLMPFVSAAGVYVLTIVNPQNGCSSTASTTVAEDLAAPDADAGPTAQLHCKAPEVNLSGSSSTPTPLSFLWMAGTGGNILSGANTPMPTVNAPGTYTLLVTNLDNGCTASDVVAITEQAPPAFTPELEQPDCHFPKGRINFGPVTGGLPPFRYSLDGGQQFSGAVSAGALAPGAYELVVMDAFGCTAATTVTIDQPFFPEVSLAVGPVLSLGDSLQLEPVLNLPENLVVDWQWSPALGLSCTDCPRPWASPFRPSIYRLIITDSNGCTAEADVLVQVNRRRQLYAPNIFSPNGDGENDRFLIFGQGGVTEVQQLSIFDRWGNQLFLNEHFQLNDESEGWDGRFRGQEMNPGVYIWQATIEFVDGVVEVYAGDVTLYR